MSETQTARSRRRARGRSAFRVDADHGPLVPAGRRAPDRRHPRRARLGLGGGEVFRGRTLLYLGQPFTTSGGGQIQSLATNPEDGEPDHPLRGGAPRASRRSGLTLGQLRGNVTLGRRRQRGPGQERHRRSSRSRSTRAAAGKAEKAANSLADTVIGVVSTYVDQKIALLNKQIASSKAELADIDQRVSNAVAQQQAVINGQDDLVDRQADRDQHLQQHDQLLGAAPRHRPAGAVPEPAAALAGRERGEEQDRAAGRREQDDRDEPPQRGPDRRADRPAARSARRRGRRSVPPAKGRAERRVTGR